MAINIQEEVNNHLDEINKYEERRIKEILSNYEISSFLNENNLNEEKVKEDFALLDYYLLEKEKENSEDKDKYSLYYDGNHIQIKLVRKEESNPIRKYILINDINDNLANIRMSSAFIKQDEHNLQLLLSLNKIIEGSARKGLYIYGDFGVGKTYLTSALCNELAYKEKTSCFVNCLRFADYARKMIISDPEELQNTIKKMTTCYCLVIDDIGADAVSAYWRDEVLFMILNERMNNNKITVFTSNYSLEGLLQHYSSDKNKKSETVQAKRLLDRIETLTDTYCLLGENKRRMK